MKGFVNYQIVKGIIPPIDLKNFKVVEEETDAIYLNEKELAAIYELDLSDDKQLGKNLGCIHYRVFHRITIQ
ncbi:hypothetical protein NXX42_03245 [Bacteroides thetaiotaomicron]|nr:hypothetical protein [Bacteroides thetaiotaomicron]